MSNKKPPENFLPDNILINSSKMVQIYFWDMSVFIVIFLVVLSIVPMNLKEKWEEDNFPETFREYIYSSIYQLFFLSSLIIVAIVLAFKVNNGDFSNDFPDYYALWPFIKTSLLAIAAFSFAGICSMVSYFKLRGIYCYLILLVIFLILLPFTI